MKIFQLKRYLGFNCFYKVVLLSFLLIYLSNTARAEEPRITNPKKARLITTDIDHFWQMFDKLPIAKSKEDTLAILHKYYLDKASTALNEYFEREKNNNKTDIEAQYLTILRKYPKYFASIRKDTESIGGYKSEIRQFFARQKKLYPNSFFADTYFCIGFFNSGGTPVKSGLYLGMEINCASKESNYEEWGNETWLSQLAPSVKTIADVVAHENIHEHQPTTQRIRKGENLGLLCNAFSEGGAVFLIDLITDGKGVIGAGGVNKRAYEFGNSHEKEVWEEFKKDLVDNKLGKWFYRPETKDFPRDMGYYMGYKICQSYYQNAKDKKQAIQDIIEVTDCEALLQKSKYADKFQ